MLLNPRKFEKIFPDEETNQIFIKTIDFFEEKGLASIKMDDRESSFCDDYLEFNRQNGVYATLLTPSGYGGPNSRWDMYRIALYNELLAFYSESYQYAYQVSILGLGPIWMGDNEEIKHKTAQMLKDGGIFAFGLSEKEHGADLYSNEMKLEPVDGFNYLANGEKYYIGNGNKASYISNFGRFADTDDYVFFVTESTHPQYECIKKIETSGIRPSYVAHYALHDYPISKKEIISSGKLAWDSSLNTINVGKFQLGFASVGICTHAFYEAITHAHNRWLYGHRVTDFPHIKKIFCDAYARIAAMRLYALRSLDYFRLASAEDRRYLLFNPIQKMKVTTQGVKVVDMLLDAITAKGFEQDTFFESAIRDIGMIPRLEGTAHVNMALVIKFMANYFLGQGNYAQIPQYIEMNNDVCTLKQTAGNLRSINFPNYLQSYEGISSPNIEIFQQQVKLLRDFLINTPPSSEQANNKDYMLALGEIFTMAAYAQLILENIKIYNIEIELADYIFNFMVRDTSGYSLDLLMNFNNSSEQEQILRRLIMKPNNDKELFEKVWNDHVLTKVGIY